jgi:ABC-type sugar transport system ATPase subunit
LRQDVENLSGGNRQKVVLAKWLISGPELLIFDEPTRGIDVGAKAEIWQLMRDLADQGKAVLMISSELPEVIGMSDRVVVMHRGRIVGEMPGATASEESVMMLATYGKAHGD